MCLPLIFIKKINNCFLLCSQDKALAEIDEENPLAESNESDSEDNAVDRETAVAEKEKVNKNKKKRELVTFTVQCKLSYFYCFPQGNRFFKDGRYDDAVECYTRGMAADPYSPVLPTNRATAFFRLKK